MDNATGNTGDSAPRPAYSTLPRQLGALRVSFTDGFGDANDRLDNVRAGLFAIATGTIRDIHLHGDDDDPRATFTLVGPTGDSAIVAVSTDAHHEFFGDLVNGRPATVHGTVVRPFPNSPAHLQMLSLHHA